MPPVPPPPAPVAADPAPTPAPKRGPIETSVIGKPPGSAIPAADRARLEPDDPLQTEAGSAVADPPPQTRDRPAGSATEPASAQAAAPVLGIATELQPGPPAAPSHTAAPEPASAPMLAMAGPSPVDPGHGRDMTAPMPAASRPATAPAEQVAPALIHLAQATSGASRLTVRLDPEELGQVEIRIDRGQAQAPRVRISVERADTLMLLLKDQPRLERMLDQAGLPSAGRDLSFHLTPAPPPVAPPADTPAQASQGHGGTAGWQNASADGGGGSSGGAPRHGPMARDAGGPDADTLDDAPRSRRLRAGLDITA